MADWRQIQARIRKAKTGADAAAKLAELYERTRDGMVAFELAQWQEKAGEHAEAARWYTAAAERFRRSQWRSKAEAALARLRAPAGATSEPVPDPNAPADAPADADAPQWSEARHEPEAGAEPGPARPEAAAEAEPRARHEGPPSEQAMRAETAAEPARSGPRRRGRRGGRNRRRSRASSAVPEGAAPRTEGERPEIRAGAAVPPGSAPPPAPDARGPGDTARPAPPMAVWRGPSRAGEPALASRMAQLESQLRRLLACPQSKLDRAESAPAGPGVLLLSDSDQITHYYVESCQTLRVAVGNLVRGNRGAKQMPQLKERLAENLGIAESRVTGYLKQHCAVRWLELDEGAPELAHFAIAVLRPVVNE